MNTLFPWVVKRRETIITLFKLVYLLLGLGTLLGSVAVLQRLDARLLFVSKAGLAGQVAIVVYILTLIPGMVRRLGIRSKTVSLIMIFRRYLGLLMFFLVLYHYMMMRGVSLLRFGISSLATIQIFELFGMAAFLCVIALAATSNDLSTNKLGVWWGRIHNLTYVLVWIIFFHVALQKIDIWTALIGVAAIVELATFIYPAYKKRKSDQPVSSP